MTDFFVGEVDNDISEDKAEIEILLNQEISRGQRVFQWPPTHVVSTKAKEKNLHY